MEKTDQQSFGKRKAARLLTDLDQQFTASELNSLLLELFRIKIAKLQPARVLQNFTENRFVRPAETDPIALKKLEIEWLELAKIQQYKPVLLSPLSPIGCCSVMGKVDQNNVVSALRGTEVLSDATNVLALKIAQDIKKKLDKHDIHRYATTHRHVRAQAYQNPAFSAHFSIFCMVAGAFDQGNFKTEWQLFSEQLVYCYDLLDNYFDQKDLLIRLYLKEDIPALKQQLTNHIQGEWKGKRIEFAEAAGTSYYEVIQFKIFLQLDGQEIDLADGGFVDWTRQLLSNHKHRLFISGIGLERVLNLSS